MHKLEYLRRDPRLWDYNALIEAVNQIIDKINSKLEIESIEITREVKDFKFFNGEEVILPFKTTYSITTTEDASNVFSKYAFTYKEMNKINDAIIKWKVVALTIKVTELVTEKDKKQEQMFQVVESLSTEDLATKIDIPAKKETKPKKKRWKTSWN